jgi:hypothetical protein
VSSRSVGVEEELLLVEPETGVTELLAALLARGNGAAFQRAVYRRSGSLPEVIRRAVAVTGHGQPS